MNLILLIIWIAVITTFSIFGALYAKKYNKPDGIIGIYVAFVLLSNILAVKISEFDLGIITLYATAASIIFPVTFLLTDIVNERFGRKETHKMIFIALIAQIAASLFIYLAIKLPTAPFWTDQENFIKLIGFAPRVMLASWIAFMISENTNAVIFSWFKK